MTQPIHHQVLTYLQDQKSFLYYDSHNQSYYLLQKLPTQQHPTQIFLKKPAFNSFQQQKTFITLDQAFLYIGLFFLKGDNSSYQKRISTILAAQWIFYSILVMGLPIIFLMPQFICTGQICTQSKYCQTAFDYRQINNNSFNSVTSQFKLFCNNQHYVSSTQGLFFLGGLVGGFIFPALANVLGRKITMILAIFVGSCSIIGSALSPSFQYFIILFTLSNIGMYGYQIVIMVFITQISGVRFRNISTNIMIFAWAIGQLFLPNIALFINEWRILIIVCIGLPLFSSIFFLYYCTHQSPRYLIIIRYLVSKKKFDKAQQVLRKISIYNKRPPYCYRIKQEMEYQSQKASIILYKKAEKQKLLRSKIRRNLNKIQRNHYIDLFKYKTTRNITFILASLWFYRYFSYFILNLYVEEYTGNLAVTMSFLAIAQLIAAFISIPIKLKKQRKLIIMIALISSTLCWFILIFQSQQICYFRVKHYCLDNFIAFFAPFVISFNKINKFSNTFLGLVLYTYTPQLYPTQVRSVGFGVVAVFGQIGSISAPFYRIIFGVQLWKQSYISLMSILNLLLTFYLPETLNKQLKTKIEQLNEIEMKLLY